MKVRFFGRVTCVLAGILAIQCGWASPFTLTILHTNDLHAHVEPTKIGDKFYGGYARLATTIIEETRNSENPILLDAGDVFQGTMFFNVYQGLADLSFMNVVGYRAMAIGNHEFDRGPAVLANFAHLARFPLLSANLDVSQEESLKTLVKPYIITEVGGEKIGLIGAVTPDLPYISSIGPNVRMKDLVKSVQSAVDEIQKQGVNKIILIAHCGLDEDKITAGKVKGLDVIVGGHSHTLMGDLEGQGLNRKGPAYPTVIEGPNKNKVLVVQAWDWGKVLGKLKVTFNEKGEIESYEGAPILITDEVGENGYIAQLISAFQLPLLELKNKILGESKVELKRDSSAGVDPLMANVLTDAMLEATKAQGVVAAFTNRGGIRASLPAGPITYGNAIEVQPFNNTLVVLEVTGAELKQALEHGAVSYPEYSGAYLFPSKGCSYVIDPTRPKGEKVVSITINGEKVSPDKTYKICLNSFTASGGDAHEVLKNAKGNRVDTGTLDIDVLIEYLKANSPIDPKDEGRVRPASSSGLIAKWSFILSLRGASLSNQLAR